MYFWLSSPTNMKEHHPALREKLSTQTSSFSAVLFVSWECRRYMFVAECWDFNMMLTSIFKLRKKRRAKATKSSERSETRKRQEDAGVVSHRLGLSCKPPKSPTRAITSKASAPRIQRERERKLKAICIKNIEMSSRNIFICCSTRWICFQFKTHSKCLVGIIFPRIFCEFTTGSGGRISRSKKFPRALECDNLCWIRIVQYYRQYPTLQITPKTPNRPRWKQKDQGNRYRLRQRKILTQRLILDRLDELINFIYEKERWETIRPWGWVSAWSTFMNDDGELAKEQ